MTIAEFASDASDVAQAAECDHLPVIDLTDLSSDDISARQKLADAFYEACTTAGFFYIKNHGISKETIKAAHQAAERFFSLPKEKKMRCFIGNTKQFWGYVPFGMELATGTEQDGETVTEEDASALLSEAFDIGYEIAMDGQKMSAAATLPTDDDQHGIYGGNQWPDEDDTVPGFRDAFLAYCRAALDLCRQMMRIFALALDVDESTFDARLVNPGAAARMMHYPAQPSALSTTEGGGGGGGGLGAHTDYECLAILSQPDVAGLEVLNSRGDWMAVPPIEGTLVVNVADCLSIFSNKKFKSTVHRVVNLTGRERYTIPFFFGVDHDSTVSVLENHVSQDLPPCREPFKAGEWVRYKATKAYGG